MLPITSRFFKIVTFSEKFLMEGYFFSVNVKVGGPNSLPTFSAFILTANVKVGTTYLSEKVVNLTKN